MTDICIKHGCELKIRWYMEGTPFQDFDGLYCPACESERIESIERFRRDNPRVVRLEEEAEAIRKKALLCSPPDRMNSWDEINGWFLKVLKNYF